MNMYSCRHCDQSFETPQKLGGHVRTQHANITKRKDPKCKKCKLPQSFFSTAATFAKHCKNCKGASTRKIAEGKKEGRTRRGERPIRDIAKHGGLPNSTKDRRRGLLASLAMEYLNESNRRKLVAVCLPGLNPDRELTIQNGWYTPYKPDHVLMFENDPRVLAKTQKKGVIAGDIISGVSMAKSMVNKNRVSIIDLDMCASGPNLTTRELLQPILMDKNCVADVFALRVTACSRSPKSKQNVNALGNFMRSTFKLLNETSLNYRGGDGRGSPMRLTQWVVRRK
jgi:hypothetical protein